MAEKMLAADLAPTLLFAPLYLQLFCVGSASVKRNRINLCVKIEREMPVSNQLMAKMNNKGTAPLLFAKP